MLFVIGLPVVAGKWITWWGAALFTLYAAIKEFAIDPYTEPAGWGGGADAGDGDDFGFYMVGVVLGLIVVYFSQLKGSMWPWPPRCRPCCPPTAEEDAEYTYCCGLVDDDSQIQSVGQRVRDAQERADLLQRGQKELEMTGLRHD